METITKQIEKIKEDICDNYCKFHEQYQFTDPDDEEAFEQMLRSHCESCPLNKL